MKVVQIIKILTGNPNYSYLVSEKNIFLKSMVHTSCVIYAQ